MIAQFMDQYSPEWFAARVGIPSSSNFDKIVTSTGAASKQQQKYMYGLAGELLLGTKAETYQNANMVRGLELEEESRQLYELINGVEVQTVGLCFKNEQRNVSCSPDGLVGEDGLLEIKCPTLPVFVEYLLKGEVPTTYIQQTQGQLWVTGREWVDFMAYYPGLSPLIVRSYRNEKFIERLEKELLSFLKGLNEIYNKLITQ